MDRPRVETDGRPFLESVILVYPVGLRFFPISSS